MLAISINPGAQAQRRKQGMAAGALLLGLVLSVILTMQLQRFGATVDAVVGDTLRLHVRAADNSVAAQYQKLLVRDAVLAVMRPLAQTAPSKAAAEQAVANDAAAFEIAAQRALRLAGAKGQAVHVAVVSEYFAATEYEAFTLPPGTYRALRVEIGRHEGHNWWCVLYPSLCLSACSPGYEQPEENALVVGDYELRFALLDWWNRLCGFDRAPAQ